MTPKQTLMAHLAELHPHQAAKLPKRQTLKQLQSWHGLQHHRFSPGHYHAGVNLGPGNRPPGWRTGEDAVRHRE